MSNITNDLLDALKCGMKNTCVEWQDSLTQREWTELVKEAQKHDILPMLIESVDKSRVFETTEEKFRSYIKEYSRCRVIYQAAATAEFELLYSFLIDRGLKPIVIKGMILRSLYPNPELRHSADEDLLITADELPSYHQAMLDYGLTLVNPDEDIDLSYEVAYKNDEKHLYIELHKLFFPPESKAYANMNYLFDGVRNRCVSVMIYGQKFFTLSPTDHLLYLICHAFKHFLHSGVGIRQIADITIFVNAFEECIDWNYIYSSCQSIQIEVFTAALFKIGLNYLILKSVPPYFSEIDIDEEPLLMDIMTGGLYGAADMDRLHSGNMTLEAVSSERTGQNRNGLLHSLFPGKSYLQQKFKYAKENPVLIPIAWAQRILLYLKNSRKSKLSPARSISIGNARIKLLEQYKVVNR